MSKQSAKDSVQCMENHTLLQSIKSTREKIRLESNAMNGSGISPESLDNDKKMLECLVQTHSNYFWTTIGGMKHGPLEQIFLLAPPVPPPGCWEHRSEYEEFRHAIVGVCSMWRRVALNIHPLWTNVGYWEGVPLAWIQLILDHSDRLPLRLDIWISELINNTETSPQVPTSSFLHTWPILKPHLNRLTQLHAFFPDHIRGYTHLHHMIMHGFPPNLTHLHIVVAEFYDDDGAQQTMESRRIIIPTPNTLSFFSYSIREDQTLIDLHSFAPTTITHLQLVHLSPKEAFSLAEKCPCLLHLDYTTYEEYGGRESDRRILLPSTHTVLLSGEAAVNSFFDTIRAINIHTLGLGSTHSLPMSALRTNMVLQHMHINPNNIEWPILHQFLKRTRVKDVMWRNGTQITALAGLPNLRSVSVDALMWKDSQHYWVDFNRARNLLGKCGIQINLVLEYCGLMGMEHNACRKWMVKEQKRHSGHVICTWLLEGPEHPAGW
ncbi:hypothetical protein BS47DRAFT_1357315 [Hydnum rufescens UP504]|uniref:Uncharacterized protein n=1 Tax=Hydnum rufescens UP504 TaxID=1448309 RepID=A0A9P6BBL4_9AGAM|nr:hypothetical protein BS47DRAFT_1357315 [Hydnum rufescens UP504]